MITIAAVDAGEQGARLLRLFDEHEEDARHPRAVLAEGQAQLWLALHNDACVGGLLGRRLHSSDSVVRGGVDNLLVDARYRRRGIARRLMLTAEAHYQRLDLGGMELSLNAANAIALALYESLGYRIVAHYTRTRPNSDGVAVREPRLRMRKPFPPNVTPTAGTFSG